MGDVITLKNGDRITGAIVKKAGGDLTVKTELFGTIVVAWEKVDSVKAETQLNVSTTDGKTAKGTISVDGGNVAVAGLTTPAANIATIRDSAEEAAFERLQHPGWGQLWSGSATVGFAGSAGNAETLTFTTGVTASRTTRTDKTSLYFNTIKASAFANGKNSDTAQATRGGFSYDHNIADRMYIHSFNDYEYDRFQNLDLRFVAGGGLGYHAWKNATSNLDISAGFDYIHSSYATPSTVQAGEFNFGDTFSRKLGKTGATLVQSATFFDSMNHTTAFRANFDTGTAFKIAKWLTWNVSLSDRYVNQPAAGRKTNDLLYTTGLGFTFAR